MFNILLVDDEELALTTLRYALPWKDYGFTDIHFTTSSLDALEFLKKQHFDACFVDIRMPDMNGLELISIAQHYTPATLFVIVSGYSDFSYAQQALKYDVLDYCLKPVVPEDCIPVLEKLNKRIFSKRISNDPLYTSRLLKEEAFCQEFLSCLTSENTECNELTLLLVRTNNLIAILSQIDQLLPAQVFFLGKGEALIIWKGILDPNNLALLLKDFLQSTLLIYDTVSANTVSFQNAVKYLCVTCHSSDINVTGIQRIPSVQEEAAVYFSNILSYIDANYANHLTLQNLAHDFGINYSYLSQLFKKTIGISFTQYLTNIRLKHACELLSSTYKPIIDIAESVGFNDYHYFCNTFKNNFSMTPSQYRNVTEKEIDS